MPPDGGIQSRGPLIGTQKQKRTREELLLLRLILLLVLASLICDTAAGLASGLAGSLALAAAALLRALAQVTGLDRLDVLHQKHLLL